MVAPLTMVDLFEDFIRNKEDCQYNTLQTYKSTINHFRKFQNQYHKMLTPANTNVTDVEYFVKYLQQGCGLVNSTATKYLKNFKVFYNYLRKIGAVNNNVAVSVTIKNKKFPHPVFTKYEIDLLWKCTSKLRTQNQKKYRDLLLILCYTGLRVSELKELNSATVDLKTGIFVYCASKTNDIKKKYIPNMILKLVKEYFIDIKTNINSQKFNKIIKEVCLLAGINETTMDYKYVDGKLKKTPHPKYKLVSTHIGRRTYSTELSSNGTLSHHEAIVMTGHSSTKMFENYVHHDENAVIEKNKPILNSLYS